MEKEIKYPFRVGIEKLEFFNEEVHQEFKNDFDEVYNVFLAELDQLMFKWGVRKIDAHIFSSVSLERNSTP